MNTTGKKQKNNNATIGRSERIKCCKFNILLDEHKDKSNTEKANGKDKASKKGMSDGKGNLNNTLKYLY